MTEVIKAKDPGSHEIAAKILKESGVIIYPTETLYGIGALATDERAVKKIYEIKGRPHGNPIPLLVKDLDMMGSIGELNPSGLKLAAKFLPGALTLVLNLRADLPSYISAGTGKIALRISNNPFVKLLFNLLDKPLTSTSANPSGVDNLRNIEELYNTFNGRVDLIIDSGNIPPSKGSTVIDVTCTPPEILREGDIAKQVLKEFI